MLANVKLTAADVLRRAEEGEGARVEFKRVLPRDERAARTLCALANTRGGLLLVGVTDGGRIHGVHRPELVSGKLARISDELIEPALPIATQVVEVGGPRVVACLVPRSRARPHAVRLLRGGKEILVRVGSSNRVADGPTLEALRRGGGTRGAANGLAGEIVAWVRAQQRLRTHPAGAATVARFAQARNVGEARARRAFVKLERRGLLVAHGAGRTRVYAAP